MSESPKSIYLFPGQGSQYRGMGSDLFESFESVRRLYEQANDVVGYDLAKLCFEGPEESLNLTRRTQPALLTHHIACLTVYRELAETPVPAYATAGHSLGEYSALVAAGALSFEQALKLVQTRGDLMGEFGTGEMLATQLDPDQARRLADEFYCAVAALNLPSQTVVGGAVDDLDALAEALADRFPRQRAVRLKTEGAFHTYYMVEAATRFRPVLVNAAMTEPATKVVSNYTGTYHEPEVAAIKARLFFQLFHPVNWVGCLQTAVDDGVEIFIEFGGGIGSGEDPGEKRPNLESIVKRATRGAQQATRYLPCINVGTITAAALDQPGNNAG